MNEDSWKMDPKGNIGTRVTMPKGEIAFSSRGTGWNRPRKLDWKAKREMGKVFLEWDNCELTDWPDEDDPLSTVSWNRQRGGRIEDVSGLWIGLSLGSHAAMKGFIEIAMNHED